MRLSLSTLAQAESFPAHPTPSFGFIFFLCARPKSLRSCPTLCDTVDGSPQGSSVFGDSPGRNTGVGCHALLQGIFPTQGLNLDLLHAGREVQNYCRCVRIYLVTPCVLLLKCIPSEGSGFVWFARDSASWASRRSWHTVGAQ